MALISRLLVMLAVLLMPFGMAAAPAAPAAPVQPHHSAAMPMEHCPDPTPAEKGKLGFAACTMVCSAALPALDSTRGGPLLIACVPQASIAAPQLRGLHPETATPPPKRS
jgi:hypothetical protein